MSLASGDGTTGLATSIGPPRGPSLGAFVMINLRVVGGQGDLLGRRVQPGSTLAGGRPEGLALTPAGPGARDRDDGFAFRQGSLGAPPGRGVAAAGTRGSRRRAGRRWRGQAVDVGLGEQRVAHRGEPFPRGAHLTFAAVFEGRGSASLKEWGRVKKVVGSTCRLRAVGPVWGARVAAGAGVKAGRRPPVGRGLDAGEERRRLEPRR
jgi:hypothetical protein